METKIKDMQTDPLVGLDSLNDSYPYLNTVFD